MMLDKGRYNWFSIPIEVSGIPTKAKFVPVSYHVNFNDGWAGASFNLDNSWVIHPGTPLRLKYRVHLHRHDAIAGEVASRYEEYICKPIFH